MNLEPPAFALLGLSSGQRFAPGRTERLRSAHGRGVVTVMGGTPVGVPAKAIQSRGIAQRPFSLSFCRIGEEEAEQRLVDEMVLLPS